MISTTDLVWGNSGRQCGGPITVLWSVGIVVLHGVNGCGKTTLLRTLVGVVPAIRGSVAICGHDLVKQPVAARRQLGWMPDRLPVPPTTRVRDLFALVRWAKKLPPGLPSLAETLAIPALIDRPLGACSLGQQRRACLIAAIMGNPSVLVLDEPDRGLDPSAMTSLIDHIHERTAARLLTIMVTHSPDLASRLGTTSSDLAELSTAGRALPPARMQP